MGPGVDIDLTDKSYPVLDLAIFSRFRLRIAPSSIVALVGPSGVGKSTLLRMIAGIDNAYSGTIAIDGIPAGAAAPPGFVFQDARLLPWLSARANIIAVRPEAGAGKAAMLLDRVGLKGYEDAYPHQLSGGMQRRVALARAMSVNPRFWLFDEPFVSLDRQLVGELQQLFLELALAEAPTVVMVTHLAEDAARLATRAVVLRGRPAQIVADMALDDHPAARNEAVVAAYGQQIEALTREQAE